MSGHDIKYNRRLHGNSMYRGSVRLGQLSGASRSATYDVQLISNAGDIALLLTVGRCHTQLCVRAEAKE